MIGLYITGAILVTTWIFWSVTDWYYRKHPMELFELTHGGKPAWDEIVFAIMRVVSILGLAYCVVYLFITWK